MADIDDLDSEADRVVMMTLHAAKGLEFSQVYIVGMEDGLFPGDRSVVSADSEDMEEERRLAYVGITRAKEDLTLTGAVSRMVRGQWMNYPISRFVREIPDELIDSSERIKPLRTEGFDNSSIQIPNRLYAEKTSYAKPKAILTPKRTDPSKKPYNFMTTPGALGSKGYGKTAIPGLTKGSEIAADVNYKEGMQVSHIKFGKGVITQIDNQGTNTYITINFENYGTRVLDSRFAKLNVL